MQNDRKKEKGVRVIGIDPGYERVGVAILEKKANGKERVVYSSRFTTPRTIPHEKRLVLIADEVSRVIDLFEPDILAIEKLFFSSNQKTALLVSEARGVILCEAARHKLSVTEFTPIEIKAIVAGDGRADKRQIMKMISLLAEGVKGGVGDDECDAIAVALACLSRSQPGQFPPE